jgi:hypothetical protein
MSDRSPWSIALSSATLTVVVAGAWLVGRRLDRLEQVVERRGADPAPVVARGERPGRAEADKAEPAPGTIAALEKRVDQLARDSYDQYSELMGDVHQIKQTTKQTQAAVRTLGQQIAKPGSATGVWGLAPAKAAMTPELLAGYRAESESYGVKIEPGRVEVRGFLNMSPNTAMPIEYFVTRWPESGHETLVHVLGKLPMNEDLTPDRLRGLLTAVYKGLVVAGFTEGENSSYDASKDPKSPTWVPPTGDVVYVGVRYSLHGKLHLARASDWVVDPIAASVLPADCFRFAGSRRQEDFETGDEMLTAEAGGLLVSVYRNPTAMIEIADPNNLNDGYRYNNLRIPKPLIAVLGRHEAQLDMVRDREEGSLRVLSLVRDGTSAPLSKAPVLLVKRDTGAFEEVAFRPANDAQGGFIVRDEAIKTSPDWRVRADLEGRPLETTGFDPLYVDLVFSKTPIVPEGDGALPLEPIPPQPKRDVAPKGPDGMDGGK